MMPSPPDYDILLAGAGPAGLAAALLLARTGFRIALVSPAGPVDDKRTTALLGGSVTLLEDLGVWGDLVAEGQVVDVMRLVDDTSRLIRAPEVTFHAREIGLDCFGANVPNETILRILGDHVARLPNVTRIAARITAARALDDRVEVDTGQGATLGARLAIAGDGRKSLLREAAGIAAKTWAYPQSALVLNLATQYPHDRICTEFHGPNGPFVLVPLPGDHVSIVLLDTPATVERLAALDDQSLGRALETRAHSMLGKMTVASPRQVYPLTGLVAKSFGQRRVALIGEAAHVFPPVGAQGLNLGLRDVAHLGEAVGKVAAGDDPGTEAVAAYDRLRRFDITSRTYGVDIADRLLLSDLLPAQILRSVGLGLAGHLPPLRRLMMREGLVPGLGAPRIMRGMMRAR